MPSTDPDIFEIPVPEAGRLMIVNRPRGGEWLASDLARWKRAGISHVVSLLEPAEEKSLDLADESESAKSAGMLFTSFPISDRGIPNHPEEFSQLADTLADAIRSGEAVAIHCRQSIGRAPLTAIAILHSLGSELNDAIIRVSIARGRDVPETREQLRFLQTLSVPVAV